MSPNSPKFECLHALHGGDYECLCKALGFVWDDEDPEALPTVQDVLKKVEGWSVEYLEAYAKDTRDLFDDLVGV